MKKLLLLLYVALCVGNSIYGQSRFHVDVDGTYSLGLHESRHKNWSIPEDGHPYGFSGSLSVRYDLDTRWSAGVGIGLARDYNENRRTIPIFATVRFKALKRLPEPYVFAKVGYTSIDIGSNTDSGFTGTLGVGYTKMFAKHFGLNFQLGYNLQTFNNEVYIGSDETDVRRSITFGMGVTF